MDNWFRTDCGPLRPVLDHVWAPECRKTMKRPKNERPAARVETLINMHQSHFIPVRNLSHSVRMNFPAGKMLKAFTASSKPVSTRRIAKNREHWHWGDNWERRLITNVAGFGHFFPVNLTEGTVGFRLSYRTRLEMSSSRIETWIHKKLSKKWHASNRVLQWLRRLEHIFAQFFQSGPPPLRCCFLSWAWSARS